MSLLHQQRAPNIHLVDIVPDLMHSLSCKLEAHFPDTKKCQWHTHCLDIKELPLSEYGYSRYNPYDKSFEQKHLVIISGIGGELTAQCVKEITLNNPNLNISFLLCPVHHVYTLRAQLIELDMILNKEVLIKENKRFYEAIWVSNRSTTTQSLHQMVSPVGNSIWKSQKNHKIKEAQEYLKTTLDHYQRINNGLKKNDLKKVDTDSKSNSQIDLEISTIIKAYQSISKNQVLEN
jgi:tRNA (adenine22-N1)-methyltransferase